MRFEFLSFELCTMAAESEDSNVMEKNDEIANEVDKQNQNDVLFIQIKRRKRSAKTKVTKLRHELERLWVKDSEVTDIESMIEQLWAALEDCPPSMSKSEKTLGKKKLLKSQKPSKKTYKGRSKRDKMRSKSARAKS